MRQAKAPCENVDSPLSRIILPTIRTHAFVNFKLSCKYMTQTCRENKLHNNDEPPSSRRRTVSSDKRDLRGLLRRTQRSGVVEPLPHRCGLQRRRHGAGRARAHMQRHLQQLHPHGAALRTAVHSGGQGPTRELLQQR